MNSFLFVRGEHEFLAKKVERINPRKRLTTNDYVSGGEQVVDWNIGESYFKQQVPVVGIILSSIHLANNAATQVYNIVATCKGFILLNSRAEEDEIMQRWKK